jgi:hypothetical protein
MIDLDDLAFVYLANRAVPFATLARETSKMLAQLSRLQKAAFTHVLTAPDP